MPRELSAAELGQRMLQLRLQAWARSVRANAEQGVFLRVPASGNPVTCLAYRPHDVLSAFPPDPEAVQAADALLGALEQDALVASCAGSTGEVKVGTAVGDDALAMMAADPEQLAAALRPGALKYLTVPVDADDALRFETESRDALLVELMADPNVGGAVRDGEVEVFCSVDDSGTLEWLRVGQFQTTGKDEGLVLHDPDQDRLRPIAEAMRADSREGWRLMHITVTRRGATFSPVPDEVADELRSLIAPQA